LQRICGNGRYVVLGRDMGTAVFPETRYKFFVTADPTIREIRDSGSSAGQSVAKRDRSDAHQTLIPENATVIDTGSKSPEEVLVTMLDDVIGRTPE
jgi:cytidylate kinase